jgi:hypothetical protein
MSERVYDTDNGTDYAALLDIVKPSTGIVEVFPRQTLYGSDEALAIGLEPIEAVPDVLLQPDQYEDAIKEAHELQTMPIYAMYNSWRPKGTKYNQDGLGYCWTWSGTGCVMTTRAAEDKDLVLLAPVSMGYLVGWANRGNYLESFIKGAREQGICPAEDGNINSLNRDSAYWNRVGQRDRNRLDKVWDTRASAMTQHCISGLCYGRSGYCAWNELSHAMELVGIRMVNGKLQWDISNSHDESDVITMTGSRAVPDECYFFISTRMAEDA